MSNQDYEQEQYGQQGTSPAADQPPADQGGMLGGARQQAEDQVNNTIDEFANRVPGSQRYAQQAKDQADNALGDIENEAEKRMGDLGGAFGGQRDQ